ncbi:MAG: dephospho-CoA kinase [Bacteroidota bacterium]
MTKPLRIGLTGGIGTGKSTIANIFGLLGVPVYNADSRAKQLMESDRDLSEKIQLLFGEESYREGNLNRQFLAEKVFNDNDNITKLNAIVHPAVARDFDNWYEKQDSGYVLKEAALLFENGSFKDLDATILIISPLALRIERIKSRDPQRSEDQIMHIINKQIDVEEAKQYTEMYVVNNEQKPLIPQVLSLHNLLKEKSPG